MPPVRATYLTWGEDQQSDETRKFIEDAGVLLTVRDIGERPLTEHELDSLIKHMDPRHFLNVMSEAYTKHGLEKAMPERHELLKLMAEDHTLLRRPIIYTARLVTVGSDRNALTHMLQISANGNGVAAVAVE
jgi:arsenate reductase-like glutaredoxin family protein